MVMVMQLNPKNIRDLRDAEARLDTIDANLPGFIVQAAQAIQAGDPQRWLQLVANVAQLQTNRFILESWIVANAGTTSAAIPVIRAEFQEPLRLVI